jgi:hypothetical protein
MVVSFLEVMDACRFERRRGSRIFFDNQLTDGGEVVNLIWRPFAFYSQEDSWYSFLLEAESSPRP